MPFSRGSSGPGDLTYIFCVSCRWILYPLSRQGSHPSLICMWALQELLRHKPTFPTALILAASSQYETR